MYVNDTVFVDPTYGNDTSGLREQSSYPFATIAAAVSAANAYDTILLSAGTHNVNAPITMKAGLWICGNGDGSVIQQTANNLSMFNYASLSDWGLRDLRINGTYAGSVSDKAINITGSGCYNWKIENVHFEDIYGWAIYAGDTTNATPSGSGTTSINGSTGLVQGCTFAHCAYGWENVIGSEYHRIVGCSFANPGSYGAIVKGGNFTFSDCQFTYSAGTAVQINPGSNHGHGTFVNCRFNHNTTYAVDVNGTTGNQITLGVDFIGCDFFATSTNDNTIRLAGCGGINFNGGRLSSRIMLDTAQTMSGLVYFRNMEVINSPGTSRMVNESNSALSSASPANRARIIVTDCYEAATQNRWIDSDYFFSVAAAGTTQGTGTTLYAHHSHIITSVTPASAEAVTLPTAVAGTRVKIYNSTASTAKVFPNTSDDINDGTVNTSVNLVTKSAMVFEATDSTTWMTY